MNVLLTGGAGYIGSHVLRALKAGGHDGTVYDSLVKGHAAAVAGARLVVADVADAAALKQALRANKIDTVIHFAAFIEAGESMAAPDKYFRNNTLNALTLLEAMNECGVKRLVFSSTAAVYGNPDRSPIQETDRLAPINPYGASKLAVEYMIRAHADAFGLGAVCLRYFNVAGADPAGDIGEAHSPETHIIPLVLEAALGRRPQVKIFGDDYDTPDGTCVRDYIHVCDLAAAHVLAAGAIAPGAVGVFNLGNGEGFSVKQVIETCRTVTGLPIPSALAPRRPGDPARLVASSQKAFSQLHWRPQFPDLATIVAHAWNWHKGHPQGYGDR
ncbi:MAG: UDP-glucose 4-epimerase GalE [Planctomycetota bacterium]|nr:UDP-glucose 4-epimerase GalE [Planctomycetota bacterium]